MTLNLSKSTMILILSSSLFACGGDDSDKKSSISSFEVVGTSSPNKGVSPINAHTNGGAFKLKWKASSKGSIYTSRVYLSKNNTIEPRVDINILAQNCGDVAMIYRCGSSGNFSCSFTTENKISCGKGTYGTKTSNISTWLGGLPQQAFMILKVCDGLQSSCVTKATKVVLQ